jgi:hypothetical protein
MVATAAVLFATGVGAPAAVAALALAGGAGLAMQLPAVHDKLQAGVVALMEPVLGKETAQKLGPIVTQGLISGLMIAMVVTEKARPAVRKVLSTPSPESSNPWEIFSIPLSQIYTSAGPVFQMFGMNLDATALAQAGSMFGILGGMMPDMAKFAEGMGVSLKDFLLNPDMAKFGDFLKTVKDLPESLATLIDADFFKGLGVYSPPGSNSAPISIKTTSHKTFSPCSKSSARAPSSPKPDSQILHSYLKHYDNTRHQRFQNDNQSCPIWPD